MEMYQKSAYGSNLLNDLEKNALVFFGLEVSITTFQSFNAVQKNN